MPGTENFVKFGRVVFEIRERTGRHTARHTDTLITIHRTHNGRDNHFCGIRFCYVLTSAIQKKGLCSTSNISAFGDEQVDRIGFRLSRRSLIGT